MCSPIRLQEEQEALTSLINQKKRRVSHRGVKAQHGGIRGEDHDLQKLLILKKDALEDMNNKMREGEVTIAILGERLGRQCEMLNELNEDNETKVINTPSTKNLVTVIARTEEILNRKGSEEETMAELINMKVMLINEISPLE
ncbi:hypothetical protein WA026_002936 [Henosepilachna vigintioctopunctata]|uniref:Uncharacterized protein n=1 Tax=Henosepilachna vigintioctopunctata TaxID=420089 RepID=A0AAW1TL27_9CUCU